MTPLWFGLASMGMSGRSELTRRRAVSGMRRAAAVSLATALTALSLAGCASSGATVLTVTSVTGGGEQTLTLQPDQITCDSTSAHGLAISKPGDDVSVTADAQRYPAKLTGSIACDGPVPQPHTEPRASGEAAASDESEGGLWYFNRGKVQAAQDAGLDGSGVTIAVIDTQVNPDAPGLRGADLQVREESFCFDESGKRYDAISSDYVAANHGTNVASMILGTGEAVGGTPSRVWRRARRCSITTR